MPFSEQDREMLDYLQRLLRDHNDCEVKKCAECELLKKIAGGVRAKLFKWSWRPENMIAAKKEKAA